MDGENDGRVEKDGRAVGVGITKVIREAVTVGGVLPDQITSPVFATSSSTRRLADLAT